MDPRIRALATHLRCKVETVSGNAETLVCRGREYAVLTNDEAWALSRALSEAYNALGDNWEWVYQIGEYAARVARLPRVKALLLSAVANNRDYFLASDEASAQVKLGGITYCIRPMEAAD